MTSASKIRRVSNSGTVSESSGDSSASSPVTNTTMKTKQPPRRTRSSKRGRKSSGRDMLTGLIANEMASSWQDESNVLPEADAAPNDMMVGVSAEDIFYAQMNGESMDPSMMGSNQSIASIVSYVSDDDDELDDAIDDAGFSADTCSPFAGLALPTEGASAGLVEEAEEAFEKSRVQSRRSSMENVFSKASRRASLSSGNETMSITDEIQRHARESMPEEVRNNIPQEARDRIFGKSSLSGDETSKPTNMVEVLEDEEEKDDSSVISDISEYTEIKFAPTKEPEDAGNKVASMAPEDEAMWDVDICPSLQPDFSPQDNRSVCTMGSHESRERHKSTTTKNSRSISRNNSGGSVSFRTDLLGSIHKHEHTKGVYFHTVQVRYYERILDINPAVTNGAAIGIGWRYKGGRHVSVDKWESQRGDLRRCNGLVMPEDLREGLLKELGYTQEDIAEASRIIRKAKDRRNTTIANLSSQEGMEEAAEMVPSRKVKGLLSFLGERKVWVQ